jgi:uncharacterized protein YvpB
VTEAPPPSPLPFTATPETAVEAATATVKAPPPSTETPEPSTPATTATETVAPAEAAAAQAEATSGEALAAAAAGGDWPESARVEGYVGRKQSLPLSCESRSAADLAAFFGVEVDELEFLAALPKSDNPDRGFVGDVYGEWGQVPPNAYGVHASPVARLLQRYGLNARAHLHMQWETLQAEIAAGRPVVVWVTGHVAPGEPIVYTAADGHRTVVARFEHTVTVIGYGPEGVLIADGNQVYRRSLERFMDAWTTLRSMAVTAQG